MVRPNKKGLPIGASLGMKNPLRRRGPGWPDTEQCRANQVRLRHGVINKCRFFVFERLCASPVDEVFGVHRYHPRELRPAPATLAESKVTYTTGLLPWRDRTVGCLDDELLFYTLNKSLS